eukprot:COSAG05_NODE_7892_length_758_cov_1.429439_1_plen_52_part_00
MYISEVSQLLLKHFLAREHSLPFLQEIAVDLAKIVRARAAGISAERLYVYE